MTDEALFRYRGWLVVLAAFAMTFCGFGFGFYGHSVYLAALTTGDAALPVGLVSTAVTVYYLAAAAIMVFISDLVTRLGPRLFAIIGAATMGVSLYLIARVRGPIDLFIAYLAMAPAFAMLTNAAVANLIGPWFNQRRGLAMSLALTGGGVGGFLLVPTLVWLSGRLTFPVALQMIAAVAIPVLLVIVTVCVQSPATAVLSGASAATMTRKDALASAHYWTIAAPLMLAIMVQVGFVVHQVSFLSSILGRDGAGIAVLITAMMAAFSRVVVGFFIDRLDQRHVGAMLLAAQACSLASMVLFPSPPVAYTASAVFGFAVGVMITLPTLLIQRECPPRSFGMLSGLTIAIIQTGNAFGPSILGWLREATGSYSASIMACIVMEVAAIALILLRISPAKK